MSSSSPNSGGPAPRRIHVGCEFRFDSEGATPSIFQVQPFPYGDQAVTAETWDSDPTARTTEYLDSFGNRCQRLEMPAGRFFVRYDAEVEVSPEADPVATGAARTSVEDLPSETLLFTMPSRYCLSDVLASTAVDLFDDLEPGWTQVQGICDWVHQNIAYTMGSTTTLSDAVDVYHQRMGVCRDFAHLGITFCRALNYPARYVFGYLPAIDAPLPEEGMDFAAWMEVFVGGRWYTFDPRNNQPRVGRVLIGRGRDAIDVAMVTSHDVHRLDSMRVWAEALP